eukprot:365942-Karenia_brevis.AAC.1
MSIKRALAASAIASKSTGEAWPAVANAHTVFASPCDVKTFKRALATTAIASKSTGDAWLA